MRRDPRVDFLLPLLALSAGVLLVVNVWVGSFGVGFSFGALCAALVVDPPR